MYTKLLVALDGSEWSAVAGRMALALARECGAAVVACHVYAAQLHTERFEVMEPGLPERYQDDEGLSHLRNAHTALIGEGLVALSGGYVAPFLEQAREAGVAATQVHVEGRNYVRLLATARECGADLIAAGAHGLGAVGDGQLGSTAARLLRGAPCDVLIARRDPAGGPVLVGIDGSDYAETGLTAAAAWARALGGPLHLAAAYDPFLHRHVFTAMAESLSPDRQREVGLDRQEDLHKNFIDDGLGILYQQFLDAAAGRTDGEPPPTSLLQGKAYRAVAEEADRLAADLIVVGRHGHHREDGDLIGSNAEALVRTATTNVLVASTSPGSTPGEGAAVEEAETEPPLEWDADALARLERIPSFARPMARRGIENHVRSEGGTRVTADDVREAGRRMGMGGE